MGRGGVWGGNGGAKGNKYWQYWQGTWHSPGRREVPSFPAYDFRRPQDSWEVPTGHEENPRMDSWNQQLQSGLNGTRKAENRVASLQAQIKERRKQWEDWIEKMKAAWHREKTRHAKEQDRLNTELEKALQAQEEARQALREVARTMGTGQLATPAEAPGEAEWNAMLREWRSEIQESGADAVLRRALQATGPPRLSDEAAAAEWRRWMAMGPPDERRLAMRERMMGALGEGRPIGIDCGEHASGRDSGDGPSLCRVSWYECIACGTFPAAGFQASQGPDSGETSDSSCCQVRAASPGDEAGTQSAAYQAGTESAVSAFYSGPGGASYGMASCFEFRAHILRKSFGCAGGYRRRCGRDLRGGDVPRAPGWQDMISRQILRQRGSLRAALSSSPNGACRGALEAFDREPSRLGARFCYRPYAGFSLSEQGFLCTVGVQLPIASSTSLSQVIVAGSPSVLGASCCFGSSLFRADGTHWVFELPLALFHGVIHVSVVLFGGFF